MPTLSSLPCLKFIRRLGSPHENTTTQLYDVKFCPFSPSESIFAVAGNQHVIVARLLDDPQKGFETLSYWKDGDAVAHEAGSCGNNSVCWARDPLTGDPLVCVSGTGLNVKVLNVKTNALVRTLVGHGRPVNDLAVNPVRPYIIASGAEDHTIRIWDLSADPRQPCAAILAGHIRGLLCLTWHHSGLYLLSGGQDAAICLWVMPSLHIWPDKWYSGTTGEPRQDQHHNPDSPSQNVLNIPEPSIIYHPHFRTTEVHTDIVDSLAFYGSLIFSKGAEKGNNRIVLWRIPGFDPDSRDSFYTPTSLKAPMPPRFFATGPAIEIDDETRTAFSAKGQLKLEQLLTLDITGADYFFIRMGLLSAGSHPALAFANGDGLVSFWDLSLLERSLSGQASYSHGDLDADFDSDPILGVDLSSREATSHASNRRDDDNADEDEDAAGPVKPGRRHRRRSSRATNGASPGSKASINPRVAPVDVDGLSARVTRLQTQQQEPLSGPKLTASPFGAISAHHSVQISKPMPFNARGVAWSTEGYGRWCVVVGDMGMICVFERARPCPAVTSASSSERLVS